MVDTSKEKKIIKLNKLLREMTNDPKFTDEDRERVNRQLQKLKSEEKKSKKEPKRKGGGPDFMVTEDMLVGFNKGGAVKRYKGGLMVKPKAAKRGY